jgi:hypothetical protein
VKQTSVASRQSCVVSLLAKNIRADGTVRQSNIKDGEDCEEEEDGLEVDEVGVSVTVGPGTTTVDGEGEWPFVAVVGSGTTILVNQQVFS